MGIIIVLCINWFAAGLCAGLAIMAAVDENYGLTMFNGFLMLLNVGIGVFDIYRLIDAVQFVAEVVK